MESSTYASILATIRATPPTAFPYVSKIASSHGVSVSTVYSIYSQEVQYQVMRTHRAIVKAAPALLRSYLANRVSLVEVSDNWCLPPCVVMRRLFESCSLLNRRNPGQGVPRSAINSIFKNPSSLASYVKDDCVEVLAKELELDELTEIYSTREKFIDKLTNDVKECVMIDCICGPESDKARQLAGLEFEGKLYELLKESNISFWTEDELRDLNYIKTPDALLKVPIAVRGHVVTWIDSKATFADPKSHEKLLQDQYDKYVNRFGPGLVLYWHGYLREGVEDAGGEVLVLDAWPKPEECLKLPQL